MSVDHTETAFPANLNQGYLGMSLRDYFAAKAMQGMISQGCDLADGVAREAYQFADAMLKEREK